VISPPPAPFAGSAPAPLPSPPGYGPPPPPPPTPSAPPPAPVEPRPSWLPADAAWPPATFNASPSGAPLTSDVPLDAPAPGAQPWANVYSNVVASSASRGHAYAGFWIRFLAYIIDSLIVGIPIVILFFVLLAAMGGVATTTSPGLTQAQAAQISPTTSLINLLSLALSFGYFVFFWSQGSTPGMRVFGIRVVDQSTLQNIGVGKAVLRYVGWIVSSFCCAIGFIWAAFDSRKQGWHDKIGGTVVIYR
jgi:uncharacterized RDD family membrane protein YckC